MASQIDKCRSHWTERRRSTADNSTALVRIDAPNPGSYPRRRVSMNFKYAAMALVMSATICCSQSEGQLLDRMLHRGGCSSASSCCDTPVSGCSDCGTVTANVSPCGCSDSCGGGGCGLLGGRRLRIAGRQRWMWRWLWTVGRQRWLWRWLWTAGWKRRLRR